MKKIFCVLLAVTAVPFLGGCEEPGPFGRQVAGFFRSENARRPDAGIEFERYKRLQPEKPVAFKRQVQDFLTNEELKTSDYQAEWGRFRDHQTRLLPKALPTRE